MAGFRVIKNIVEAELQKLPVSSQTLSIGDLIERTAGTTTWAACTSSSTYFTPKAICYEAATSAATEVLAYRVTGFETCANDVTTPAAADNGDRMALTNASTVNNSGTDVTGEAVCFVQEGVTSSEIVGRILSGNGVDPDAA